MVLRALTLTLGIHGTSYNSFQQLFRYIPHWLPRILNASLPYLHLAVTVMRFIFYFFALTLLVPDGKNFPFRRGRTEPSSAVDAEPSPGNDESVYMCNGRTGKLLNAASKMMRVISLQSLYLPNHFLFC